MIKQAHYFTYALFCIIGIPAIINNVFDCGIFISMLIYIIPSAVNFILTAFTLLHKYGPNNGQESKELTDDMDRLLYFMVLGPLGTLLIISNIVLNIINKF